MSHKTPKPVLDQIKHYQRDIDDRPDDSERILRCVRRLFILPVTVQHLEETGIGKSVNALRKYKGEVGEAAKTLIHKWKAMVSAEQGSDGEQEDRIHTSTKESQKRSVHSSTNSHCNGVTKHSRKSESNHHSSYDKKQRLNEVNHVSNEKKSRDTDLKERDHHKSVPDKHSHHKDDRKNQSHLAEKYSKSREKTNSYKNDKYVKEKENKEQRYKSSSKSNHSVKELSREKRRAVNDSEDESDGSVKRRRLKSPSPAVSDNNCSDDETNGRDNRDADVGMSEIENNAVSEDEEEDEDEEEELEDEEDSEEEEEEESDDEIRPNPYLTSFIKSEPELSEFEDAIDDCDIDSDNDKASIGSPAVASDIESDDKYNSEIEENEGNHSRRSRLSADSETDEHPRHKSIKLGKEHHRNNDTSYRSEKLTHKEIDRKHEKYKPKLEKTKHSSSNEKNLVSQKHNSREASKGNSSNHHHNSSSSKNKSNSNVNHSSSHSKHREQSKENSKLERSSHSVKHKSDAEGKHKSDSPRLKEDKSRKSDEKYKSSSSSVQSSSPSKSSHSKSSSTNSVKTSSSSSSSNKENKHKSESRSASNHSSSSSKSSSRESSVKCKKEVPSTVDVDFIKKEPPDNYPKSHKEISSKSSSVGNTVKSNDYKPVKIKEPIKIKTEKLSDNEDGIDCGSGASFADALLGMTEPMKKSKKKSGSSSPQKSCSSPSVTFSKHSQESCSTSNGKGNFSTSKTRSSKDSRTKLDDKPDLLSKNIKLEPLEMDISSTLPEITPNYHPLPHYSPPDYCGGKRAKLTDEEALSSIMSTKNQRTKVFSGNKCTYAGSVPSLYNLCSHVILENIDALEYTGGVPYDLLKPVLERLSATQLYNVENYNPYLIEDTDVHWKFHCSKEFRGKQRAEMESWRDLYLRCLDEREQRLKALTANISQNMAQRNEPVRKTKLAYVDAFVKPPRNVARQQAKFGTSSATHASSKHEIVSKAIVSSKEGPPIRTVVPPPPAPSRSQHHQSSALLKKKKAPLMMKTLQFMKGNRFKR